MMKLIFTILSLSSIAARATTYYVSNAGNNSNNGTSTSTPFLTIAKALSVVSNGDSIKLKANNNWNENIIVPASNITIDSFGTGIKPLVTGFITQTGFSNIGGNVWQASTGILHRAVNTIMINGIYAHKARYPNSTCFFFTQPINTKTSLTTSLPDAPSYVGDEIVVKTTQWVINVAKVTSQSGGVLGVSPALLYPTIYGSNGFFFQNQVSFIDSIGEFAFDSSTGTLSVYSVGSPTVLISNLDTLVAINHKDNVTFNHINFTGANTHAFRIDTSTNVSVKNCAINYSGNLGIYSSKSKYLTVSNDSVQNTHGNAMIIGGEFAGMFPGFITDSCNNAIVQDNYISKTGIFAGMCTSGIYPNDGEITGYGLYVVGDSAYIKHNTIDSTGNFALRFLGRGDSIFYNYITTFDFIKVDVGGIGSYQGSGLSSVRNRGTVIYRNIILNGIGSNASQGILSNNNIAPGIYLDLYTNGITVKENTISNCLYASIFLLSDSNNVFTGNTFIDSLGDAIRTSSSLHPSFSNNTYYQRSSAFYTARFDAGTLSSDSNIFLRPVSPTNLIRNVSTDYSLAGYAAATGFDTHSSSTMPAGTLSNVGVLIYNPTLHDSTITVAPSYTDVNGVIHATNKITLAPFTSAILFPVAPLTTSTYFFTSH